MRMFLYVETYLSIRWLREEISDTPLFLQMNTFAPKTQTAAPPVHRQRGCIFSSHTYHRHHWPHIMTFGSQ